ncbi:MAG: hypothetical protein NTV94_07290 [Planctomycetota bacterium]|nr:hypothetical protein [Planctomycetota bacterium]
MCDLPDARLLARCDAAHPVAGAERGLVVAIHVDTLRYNDLSALGAEFVGDD